MVGLSRQLIADDKWVIKVKEGRLNDIDYCRFCNIKCTNALRVEHLLDVYYMIIMGGIYKMKGLILYSSLTGNTKKIAEAIYGAIPFEKDIYSTDENYVLKL